MKESHNNPSLPIGTFLRERLGTKSNQSNILDILDILDKDFNFHDRGSCPHYYSKALYGEWCRWCRVHPSMTQAELMEKALIYAMLVIPNKNVLVQIEMPKNNQSLNDRISESECKEKINEVLPKLIQFYERDGKPLKIHIEKARKILKSSTKVKNKSFEFEELIEKVLSFIE